MNDFYSYEDEEADQKGRGHLFLWTVFILLLIGLVFACWLGSFYVFGHPEEPRAYHILKKLHKLDPPRRFEVTAAPQGDFISAKKLHDKYSKYSPLELERENSRLLRNYITNYRETSMLVPYIRGRFTILSSQPLAHSDFFQNGVVALAQSTDVPQVLIEHVYTAAPQTVPSLLAMLQPGLDMSIERTLDLSAIINIKRTQDGRLMFTVVPLLYGTYALKQGNGTFGLEPPTDLNVDAGVPILDSAKLESITRNFAQLRRDPPATTTGTTTTDKKGPELVRLDAIPEGSKVPETGALPPMPVATPIPPNSIASGSKPSHKPGSTPPQVAMQGTPRPAATPPVAAPVATPVQIPPPTPTPAATIASATPAPVATPLPRTSTQGVPLQPFLAAKPDPSAPSSSSGNWRIYNPGKQPAGRHINPEEASALVDRGEVGERVYLKGQFLVTAVMENRAVLRPPTAATRQPTRVIVEYPMGAPLPAERSSVNRDESRPFEIRDVRKGADGQITIYVREITAGG